MNNELENTFENEDEYQDVMEEASKIDMSVYSEDNTFVKSGLKAYLSSLKGTHTDILTEQQFARIFNDYKSTGNSTAKDRLILGNIKLVISIAKRYNRICKSLQLEDLIQEGIFGLMTALEKYDINSGYKFSTYAYYWIRQKIYTSIQNIDKFIRVPTSISNEMIKFTEQYNALLQEQGDVTLEEFSEVYAKYYKKRGGKDKIKTLWGNFPDFKLLSEVKSLNTMVNDEDNSAVELGDLIEDKSQNIEKIVFKDEHSSFIQKMIRKACEHLYGKNSEKIDKVYYIINHSFGFNDCEIKSDIQIGKDLRMSKERVNQLRDKVLKYMKYMKEVRNERGID